MTQKKFLRLGGIGESFVDLNEIVAISHFDEEIKIQLNDAVTALRGLFNDSIPPEIQPLFLTLTQLAEAQTTVHIRGGGVITSNVSPIHLFALMKQKGIVSITIAPDSEEINATWEDEFDDETGFLKPEGVDLVIDLLAVAGVGVFNNPNMENVDEFVDWLRTQLEELTKYDIELLYEIQKYASAKHNQTGDPLMPAIVSLWIENFERDRAAESTDVRCPSCGDELMGYGQKRYCLSCAYSETV